MTPRPDPEHSIGYLIHDVARLLRRDFNRRAATLGLTQAQWQVLGRLAQCEGINQTALAEALDIHPITLTRAIDRLEAAGWVERRADPGDRRAFQLHLTRAAGPVLDDMWGYAAATREVAMAGLSPAERERAIETLRAMKRNLTEPVAENGRATHTR